MDVRTVFVGVIAVLNTAFLFQSVQPSTNPFQQCMCTVLVFLKQEFHPQKKQLNNVPIRFNRHGSERNGPTNEGPLIIDI